MTEPHLRNRLQYSFKTLIVLTLIVAAYFAGRIPFEKRLRKVEQQLQAQQAPDLYSYGSREWVQEIITNQKAGEYPYYTTIGPRDFLSEPEKMEK